MEQDPKNKQIFINIGLHMENFGDKEDWYKNAQFTSWTQNLQEVAFWTSVSRTLSYGLCNANPEHHGFGEEYTIGLQ